MSKLFGILCLAAVTPLCACSGVQVVNQTPTTVNIRYNGALETLDDAKAAAQTVCAARGKTAQLRDTDIKGTLDRIANFNCT
jgi:hypothetical protein